MLKQNYYDFTEAKFNSTLLCKTLRDVASGVSSSWYLVEDGVPWLVTPYFCSVATPDTALGRLIREDQRFTPEEGKSYKLHTKASVLLPEVTDQPPEFGKLLESCLSHAKEETLSLRFNGRATIIDYNGSDAWLFRVGDQRTTAFNRKYLNFIVSAEEPLQRHSEELILKGDPDQEALRPFTLWRGDTVRGIIMPIKLPDYPGLLLSTDL